MREWRPSLGARYEAGTTTFRVWAPDHTSVDLAIDLRRNAAPTTADRGTDSPWHDGAGAVFSRSGMRPLAPESRGYWSGSFSDLPPGTLYRYRLSGDDGSVFPDPASRFQPAGVHGPSQVVDPSAFSWSDGAWRTPPPERAVFYELHVGTFTPEGTFRAVVDRLSYVKELGVTAIELMPVGDFPGARNWGYDGVAIFAPARAYGRPDDLRALVDAAHQLGLAVYLDVIYNHLGPDGAYANAFSAHYFSDRHHSAWGSGVNLDGPHSAEVRRFFIENALHWVDEYHIDGLRLDATHALQDDSPLHFIAELTTTVRERAGRPVVFVAEDHRNLAHMLRPVDQGGWGIDAVWADDFHHQVRVHTARDHEGYYADFSGSAEDLAATLRQGWFFSGQYSAHLEGPRGTDPAGLAPKQFVLCIQNHDQIGNRAKGERLNHQVDDATFRAISTLLLLAPQTPLLFMGQEWVASSPFLFFTDHTEELGQKITEGRRLEFSAFAAFADPAQRATIPDPQRPETFLRSRLPWDEVEQEPHARMRRLYQRLLEVRAASGVLPATARGHYDVCALDEHTVMLTLRRGVAPGEDDLTVIVRLSGAGAVAAPGAGPTWRDAVLTTEDPDVAASPLPVQVDTSAPFTVHFRRPGAIVFRGLRHG
jgi:maltooligosyltrehalose trehalohydrolase